MADSTVEQPTEQAAPVAQPPVETEVTETKPAEETTKPAEENGASKATEHKSKKRENKNGSKFDPTVMPISDDPQKIRAQVEFYFGDHNLHMDEHMRELTAGFENKPVSIAELHKFKRMQRFQPYSAVVAALKESTFLTVSGPEGQEKVKRKTAWDPRKHSKDGREARSVYVKGFGDEEPSTQFDIEAFFVPFGPLNAVRLRRNDEDRSFKGSVFVEFADEETAKKFLELDPKPKYKDLDLKIMSKKDYVAEKAELIRTGQMEPNTRSTPNKRGGRGRGNFNKNFNKGGRDDWKKRRENDQKSGFRGGRGRGNRNFRDRDSRDKKDKPDETSQGEKRVDVTAQALATEKPEASESSGPKRAREDDSSAEAPPSKKVDVEAS